MAELLRTDRRHALEDALDKAWEDVSRLDLESLGRELGPDAVLGERAVSVRMLYEPFVVDLGSRSVRHGTPEGEEASPYLQVLVLHYLLGVSSSPLRNRFVSFRELDGGALYYSAFKTRSIVPLVKTFGLEPERLERVAKAMGAEPLDIGHVSFRLEFFEKVPVAVVLWLGDVEVSASASILFDASANSILPTEDLTVVAGVTSRTLIRRSRQ
jgi:hypothetical protein